MEIRGGGMSRDHNREEQRLRDLLSGAARAYEVAEEPPDDELLHIRPKPKKVKRKKVEQ